MVFGEVIVQLKKEYPHIKLIGVIPFEGMHVKWPIRYQERFFDLVESCDEVVELNYRYHPNCYRQRNQYLINHADRLIAVLDARYTRSGTMQTADMAKRKGITITYIDPNILHPHTVRGTRKLRIVK